MLAFFRVLLDRLKALLLADAALDLQAQALARAAERQAELLRRAAAYENEGLATVAADLREQAEALDLSRPLALVVTTLEAISAESWATPPIPGPASPSPPASGGPVPLPQPTPVPSRPRQRARQGR